MADGKALLDDTLGPCTEASGLHDDAYRSLRRIAGVALAAPGTRPPPLPAPRRPARPPGIV